MKSMHIAWIVAIVAVIGLVWYGMKPKVCIDVNGNARTTHRFFPCTASETAVTA